MRCLVSLLPLALIFASPAPQSRALLAASPTLTTTLYAILTPSIATVISTITSTPPVVTKIANPPGSSTSVSLPQITTRPSNIADSHLSASTTYPLTTAVADGSAILLAPSISTSTRNTTTADPNTSASKSSSATSASRSSPSSAKSSATPVKSSTASGGKTPAVAGMGEKGGEVWRRWVLLVGLWGVGVWMGVWG